VGGMVGVLLLLLLLLLLLPKQDIRHIPLS
jgi:hypothetical protein